MNPALAFVALLALVAGATIVGLVWRRVTGRVSTRRSGRVVTPADVGSFASFGEWGTLLQFSTEFCTYCPATRRVLSSLAGRNAGLEHVDVDVTHAPDIARRFDVLQTPTTLVLDRRGVVKARLAGPPKIRELEAELALLLGDTHV